MVIYTRGGSRELEVREHKNSGLDKKCSVCKNNIKTEDMFYHIFCYKEKPVSVFVCANCKESIQEGVYNI